MRPINRFMLKLIVFLLPFIVISIPIILSGEFLTGKWVAILQHEHGRSILYGPAAEKQIRFYKAESTRIENPSVIIMGDSRALQVRSFFLDKHVKFYNTGYT